MQEDSSAMERAFLQNPADSYAIFQLKHGPEQSKLLFMGSNWLRKHDLTPNRDDYDLVYTGTLPDKGTSFEKLEALYVLFNNDHPVDFTGHSLSISDVVALKQDGIVSCHYVESIGYTELPHFLTPENPLKNAEMQLEDDLGMIDGVINNGSRESSLDKLHQYQKEDGIITAPPKAAEKEH